MKPLVELTGKIEVMDGSTYMRPLGRNNYLSKVEETIKYSDIKYKAYGSSFASDKVYKLILLELSEEEQKAEEAEIYKLIEEGKYWNVAEPRKVKEGTIIV